MNSQSLCLNTHLDFQNQSCSNDPFLHWFDHEPNLEGKL